MPFTAELTRFQADLPPPAHVRSRVVRSASISRPRAASVLPMARPRLNGAIAESSKDSFTMNNDTLGDSATQIVDWLQKLVEPNSTIEIRVLYDRRSPVIRHYSSDDLLAMASESIKLSEDAKGVYFLMNPLPAEWGGSPATDKDILRRRWLLIDCDPSREGTVSSTDDEKDAARAKMVEVETYLSGLGWPVPLIADSGNGSHLLYRIDLPGEDRGLVHRVLKELARRFNDEDVSIDTKVANASRICKLYGTRAAKGEHTADRPHRLSKIIAIPEQFEVVSAAMLEKLAGEGDAQQATTGQPAPRPPAAADRVSYPDAIEQARKYLAKMDASVEGNKGSDRLIKAASVLVNDFALSDGEAFDLLMTEFNPRCRPPWSDDGVRRKIDESRKNPPNRPAKGQGAVAGSTPVVVLRDETTNLIDESWPAAIDPAAFYGVAGDIARKIEPHTEADPVAILIQILVAVGNVVGRRAYFQVEATRHYANLFTVIVGASSVARKGTAGDHVRRVVKLVDEVWDATRVMSGLASGEGLIWNVRDPINKKEPVREGGKTSGRVIEYQQVIADEGIADKRLLVFQTEFAALMKVMARDSNTLSEITRQAWDSGKLQTAAKNQPANATDAHVSLIGHITAVELRDVASQTDLVNGFANRFLWCCVQRSKMLPDGGNVDQVNFDLEIARLKAVVEFASIDRDVRRDNDAAAEWRRLYPGLSADRPGAAGAICNRGAAQVVRLSLLYALLDQSPDVTVKHLHAAIALWNYCEASVKHIFGHSLANRTANSVLNALKGVGESGMGRSDISNLLGRNKSKSEVDAALQVLYTSKLARRDTTPTAGRPVETWYAIA